MLIFLLSDQHSRVSVLLNPNRIELFWYSAGFTGIDDPYEPPRSCEVCISVHLFLHVGIVKVGTDYQIDTLLTYSIKILVLNCCLLDREAYSI